MGEIPRVFTVEEANGLLGQVVPLVEQLQGIQRSIIRINEQRDSAKEQLTQSNGHPIDEIKKQLEELTKRQMHLLEAFQSALQQLEALGCQLKDVNTGLVDFYSLRNGEPVLLCWRLGEDRVKFWHTLEEGYAGRRPLE